MAVYVDDMRAKYGRMIMCHMLADTVEELHAMADRIGVARRWHQKPGTAHSHYDICLTKRARAIAFGAVEVDRQGVVAIIKKRREATKAGEDLKKCADAIDVTLSCWLVEDPTQ